MSTTNFNLKGTNNSTSSNVFKLSQKSSNKPTVATYYGRDEKIDVDRYYKLLEENMRLKKRIQELEQKNKVMDVALKRGKIDLDSTAEQSDVESLKIENNNLKDKNLKMRKIITSLQNDLKKKGIKSSLKFKPSQYELQDYIKLIEHLQNSLNEAHEDRRSLLAQLTAFKETKASEAITEYSNDISQKNIQLSELTVKYEQLLRNFETNTKILELTKQSLSEYMEKYTIERNKNFELEDTLRVQQTSLDKAEEYLVIIEDYKAKEKQLEERIKDLCENPFIKQANERGEAFAKLKEQEVAFAELQRKFYAELQRNAEFESQIKELKEKLSVAENERETFRADAVKYQVSIEEKERQNKLFEDQFRRMAQFGKVDTNFDKMLDILRGDQNVPGDDKTWSQVNFIERPKKEDGSDMEVEEIIKDNQKLRIEKGILGDELEKTKEMLKVQTEINDELRKLQEVNDLKFKKNYKIMQDKIKELLILIDKEKIPKEYLMEEDQDMVNTNPYGEESKDNIGVSQSLDKDMLRSKIQNQNQSLDKNLIASQNIPADKSFRDTKEDFALVELMGTQKKGKKGALDDRITEFSKSLSETEYGVDENALDLYLGKATLESNAIENLTGVLPRNIITFLTVDFYLHETQTSNLVSGSNPNFNFQLTFRVNVDDYLLRHINNESITLELYFLKDNIHSIFATGKIPLNQLVKAETGSKTRVVKGLCTINSSKDKSIVIGSIKYKMRMRFSILEAIKSLNERLKLTKELSPINDINDKMVGELLTGEQGGNLIEYRDPTNANKVYSIKIVIVKAEGIKLKGGLRKVNPYIYYNFYDKGEHYSSVSSGINPEFRDIQTYVVIYTSAFNDYLENKTFEVYLFDSAKPLEVDVGKEVELIKSNEESGLLGIAKIKLKDLILKQKIEGLAPLTNEDGKINVGYLTVNITMEETKI
ncbi:MAG: hypothetical protein MJ252_15840 [archaeon]|nr:hypothetical protein [archaeon]